MKIIYHHRTLGDGAEGIHISEMVKAFQKLGHEVLLLGPACSMPMSKDANISVLSSLKHLFKGPLYEVLELGYNIYGFNLIRKAIKNFRPDFIYDRYITFNLSCIAAARKYNIPVFLEVNAPLAYERAHEVDEKLFFRNVSVAFEKKISSNAHKTFVVSTPLKKYLISIGVPDEKIIVLPNGADTEKFYPTRKPENLMRKLVLSEKDIIIGFVGILRPWHGIDLLLQAFDLVYKKFQNVRLLLVGDGDIRKDIERQAQQMGFASALRITGRVPHEQIRNYIALFDVAVSPKATFYASPMKIPEYMASGKAVVAPDMENIRDLLSEGVNAILFKENSAESLARAIREIVSNSKLKSSLGKSARMETQSRLNWNANAQRVLVEFQNIVKNKKAHI